MKFHLKNNLFVITMIFLMLTLFISLGHSANQLNFVLYLDTLNFTFDENLFNDSTSFKLLQYTDNGNETVWVTIPKNSTILYTNIDLKGESKPTETITTDEVYSIAVGNAITSTPENEIVVGVDQAVHLLNSSGDSLWINPFPVQYFEVFGVDIGDVTSDEGNEIAAACANGTLYLLKASDGSKLLEYVGTDPFYDVAIGNVDASTPENEIVVVGGDDNITLLDNNFGVIWNLTVDDDVMGVAVGDINLSKPGIEIVAGSKDHFVYLLNSTGQIIEPPHNYDNANILDVAIGNVNTSNLHNEVAIATQQSNRVYLLDASLDLIWYYEASAPIDTVAIGNVTADDGDEIVFGSRDTKIYVLNSSGDLILSYATSDYVQGVAVGNLTADPGNEVVAGSEDENIYILNFEYYPTNVYLDIGGDGTKDWSHTSSKLREPVSVSGLGINQAIEANLSVCTSQLCDVPFRFHSDSGGDLNITSINITYNYSTSEAIFPVGPIDAWSRTNNVIVNLTVGNQSMNISYDYPANDIEIRYIRAINNDAMSCDFAGKQHLVTNSLCDLGSDVFNLNTQGLLPSPTLLRDNRMDYDTPVFGSKSANFTTPKGEWLMNYSIWNETPTLPAIFYNVTAKIEIDKIVKSNEGLFVYWDGGFYDITPSTECSEYQKITINTDDFYTCECGDYDGNGVTDCYMVKQPHTSVINYTVNGSTNAPSILNLFSMSPWSDIWGNNFTFIVNVSDNEENNVTVNLWVQHIDTGVWEMVATNNTTGNTTKGEFLQFEIPSTRDWIGNNWYKYEYADFDRATNEYIHLFENTTPPMIDPFVVERHNTSIEIVEGDGESVSKQGSDSVIFIINVTDTHWNQNVSDGVKCSFWITTDGVDFILANSTTTNSSGFCNFTFDPNETYSAGQQFWRAGVDQDPYYNESNSTDATIYLYGELGINLTIIDQNFTRNETSQLTAKLVDGNLMDVSEPGYNCTWYINTTRIGNSTTDNFGVCNQTWLTNCTLPYSILGNYWINVTLTEGDTVTSYYSITNNESKTDVYLKGTLNTTLILPVNNSIIYEKHDISLNSTVTDECLSQNLYYHNVTWYSAQNPKNTLWCPPSGIFEIAQGMNTTWVTSGYSWYDCTPRDSQQLTAKADGELYNSNEKSILVDIWGFADVAVNTPSDEQVVWRNESYGLEKGMVKIICKVTSNATGYGQYLSGYGVNFWEKYMTGSLNYLGTNIADTDGEATYWWNISDVAVDEGNHTIKCNISDEPSLYFNTDIDENNITVTVKGPIDSTAPIFLNVDINSVEQYTGNVTVAADIYDAWGVDKVWINVTYPNKTTNSTHFMEYDAVSDTWNFTYNLTDLGDYDFTIFANDTYPPPDNNLNQYSSWFEVYLPLVLTGNLTNWNGNSNITAELNFYRNGTDSLIHQINTNSLDGYYNITVHKRLYDLEAKVSGHTVLFRNLNTTATAEQQFGTGDITNITNPLNFTPGIDVGAISPARYIVKLTAIDINSIFVNDITTITLDYSTSPNFDKISDKRDVRISKCPVYSYSEQQCLMDWEAPGGVSNATFNTTSFNETSLSVFAASETAICPNGRCQAGESCGEDYYCPDDCGKCPTGETGDTGSSSSGGGSSQVRTVCGNGICETGENPTNCPQDCGPPDTLFSVRTDLSEPQLNPGTEQEFTLWVRNNVNYKIDTSVSVTGSIAEFIKFEKDSMEIDGDKEEANKIYVTIPENADTGTYTGHIIVTGGGKTINLPVTITVSIKGATILDVLVESRNKNVGINETARFRVMLYNYGLWKRLDLNLTYYIKDPETHEIFYEEKENLEITQSKTLDKRVLLSGLNITQGRYLFNVTVRYGNKIASAYDDFEITESFFTTDRLWQIFWVVLAVTIPIAIYFGRKRYITWKASKARYIFPLDFDKLPKGKLWVGKIAETNKKAYFNMHELRTHVLTAGATGSGKSVSAMVFVEELLKEKIPVVVFDPTAQWSGFVRPCKDPNLIKFYKEFGMNRADARPYNGMIYEVTDPNVKINFDKYMNPGEITVFMLNKLEPGQYDIAVRNIIDTIFAHGWEESTKLKMVVVFDEVHRLLEKYGGSGGYVSLEKACREFRKWGIGLIMASQVLSDFKEAIKGNVLTEIQLHTKSLGDLGRVEKKYGLDYTKRVTKLEVGVGMIQNPRYNKGRPWFVSFRPTLHEPHKIPDRDLETYKQYAAILAKIEAKIVGMEKAGQDVFDLKTEFKLAQDKLKKGRFRMAKIYIDSLRKHVLEG